MLYQLIDSSGNGYIDKEKLQHLCPHLSQLEIDTIFNDFDKDHDNRIYLKELLQSNNYPRELYKQNTSNYQCNIKENMTQTQVNEVFNTLAWYENR
jgi:Ca2+-binding EF-hand superfamily protein